MDLLALPSVRALVRWRGFPYALQAAILAALLALAWLGWGRTPPPDVPAKLFAKSHLVILLVWGLWWPAMVWAAVLLGRAWCAVCPMELVAGLAERLRRLLGGRACPYPARSGPAGWPWGSPSAHPLP